MCDSALGAADYTALASVFHTIGLGGVPALTIERVDLMRRFITFIDVMYEHKVRYNTRRRVILTVFVYVVHRCVLGGGAG